MKASMTLGLDLADLFEKQAELDSYIIEKHGLKITDIIRRKRIRALKNEIAEFENCVGEFKYWSTKPIPNKPDEVLEEYVDGIHFFLSIGNDLQVPTSHFTVEIKNSLLEQFEELDYALNRVNENIYWVIAFALYRGLAYMLGWDWEKDIVPAYHEKYKKNIERQKAGY